MIHPYREMYDCKCIFAKIAKKTNSPQGNPVSDPSGFGLGQGVSDVFHGRDGPVDEAHFLRPLAGVNRHWHLTWGRI